MSKILLLILSWHLRLLLTGLMLMSSGVLGVPELRLGCSGPCQKAGGPVSSGFLGQGHFADAAASVGR